MNNGPETDDRIRVLVLKAGPRDGPIACGIDYDTCDKGAQVSATGDDGDDDDGYRALSYMWGEGSSDDPYITVGCGSEPCNDGISSTRVQIRKKLHQALKAIRDENNGQRLWVDALCINQKDTAEKSRQVGMMGKIFENAKSVIAWLGGEGDNSDTAMGLMARPDKLETFLKENDDPSGAEALWSIQEIFWAQSYVVRCGEKQEVPGDRFEESLSVLHGTEWELGLRNTFANVHRMRRKHAGGNNPLVWWLGSCRLGGFQATDKRDFVYALLGISQDCRDGRVTIVPNYSSKGVKDVFLELFSRAAECPSLRHLNSGSMPAEVAAMMGLKILRGFSVASGDNARFVEE
ncbi:heterokaryon incompatibility protein-domain-containing protein [Cladorrhinum sp. PSN332]|nr:heterokaryon incompatibility protein-domain-containing protein [Cladorrhinum sp. PSN332]